MTNTQELEFYATPGPMTDLSTCPVGALDGLPDDPNEIMKIVRWCVVSDLSLTQLHGLPVPEGRSDPQIRPAAAMIERIQELNPSPLVQHRPPLERFLGNCRHFATLTCALLRHKGV